VSTDFMAQKPPEGMTEADPGYWCAWQISDVRVNVNGANAGALLTLLGYAGTIGDGPAGEADPEEFARRIGVARIEGLTVAYERWGAWHQPGYFEMRLAELEDVAAEAKRLGGIVVWA
jgi:hypothetical protein